MDLLLKKIFQPILQMYQKEPAFKFIHYVDVIIGLDFNTISFRNLKWTVN